MILASTSSIDFAGYIIIPLSIFLMGAAASGIVFLVKFVMWLSESKEAAKSTAASVASINTKLTAYMEKTDGRLHKNETDIAILQHDVDKKADSRRKSHDDGS